MMQQKDEIPNCKPDILEEKRNTRWVRELNESISYGIREVENFNSGEIRDGYHTFDELYEYRKMYNALLFNCWAEQGKYEVHKSKRHHDGEKPFGGGWFVVVAILPMGQVTNHYKLEDWDMFKCRKVSRALYEFDRHTSQDALNRLKTLI